MKKKPAIEDEFDQGPSKSQLKRDSEALQELGQKLTQLNAAQLKKCDLPDELLDAIQEYQRLPHKHGALRRQLQFIGKLMRDLTEEDLERIGKQTVQDPTAEKRLFKALEDLRAKLLAGNAAALSGLLEQFPDANEQELRQLIRQADAEQKAGSTPVASRKLFQILRHLHGA